METKNVSPEQKEAILKSLAIAGLFAVLLLVAWLAIQLVHVFPGAFSSVASLAESVNQNQETVINPDQELGTLIITSNSTLVNSGETLAIEWSEVNAKGSFVFSYDCVDGVAFAEVSASGERSFNCDTNYNVGDINTLVLSVESEKNRYADIQYTVDFLRTNDTRPRATGTDTVTIVNTDINSQFATNDNSDAESESVAATEEETTPTTPETSPTPAVTPTPTPSTPTYTQEFTYAIPVSDPNGYTDLGATYIGVGSLTNRTFVPGVVSRDEAGAIQFSVKNFGTKTSRNWTFSMELPNGETYESPTQTALKPNERAVLTIGFPAGAPAIHTFEVEIDESSDRNSRNDSFTQTVGFAR